jgi:hypothetical protein
MSSSKENEIKVEIAMQQIGFPKTLYFNRFRVDKEDGFRFAQFGLVVASDLVDSYCCVLTDDLLLQNRASLLDYVKKLGSDVPTDIVWKGVSSSRKAEVADIVSMSFRGDLAETVFSIYSICAMSNLTRGISGTSGTVTPLPSQPLVLLRSKTVFQKELIASLYD